MSESFLLLAPAMALSLWASFYLKSTFSKYSKVSSASGATGHSAATALLTAGGIKNVQIQAVSGKLTDHYNPGTKSVGLSEVVHGKTTIAAIAVAAHEVGHAAQYAQNYPMLSIRAPIRRFSGLGSTAGQFAAMAGMIMGSPFLINVGILFFSVAVASSLLTLPVEFNASKRALEMLRQNNILTDPKELKGAKKVLKAAALTYVASTLTSLAQLLSLILASRRQTQRRQQIRRK